MRRHATLKSLISTDWKLGRSRLPFFGCYVPRNPLQIQDKNRVKDRDQEQGDEGSDGESAHLGIADRFPERAFQIAAVYAFRHEPDQAFQWLDRAYGRHDTGLAATKFDPLLKNLRGDLCGRSKAVKSGFIDTKLPGGRLRLWAFTPNQRRSTLPLMI